MPEERTFSAKEILALKEGKGLGDIVDGINSGTIVPDREYIPELIEILGSNMPRTCHDRSLFEDALSLLNYRLEKI